MVRWWICGRAFISRRRISSSSRRICLSTARCWLRSRHACIRRDRVRRSLHGDADEADRCRHSRAFTLVELLVVISDHRGVDRPAAARAHQSAGSGETRAVPEQPAQMATRGRRRTRRTIRARIRRRIIPHQRHAAYGLQLGFHDHPGHTSGQRTVIARAAVEWGKRNAQIQQCPATNGKSNTLIDPYTGYNYNTSYIGHGEASCRLASSSHRASMNQVRKPSETALFGDGQYAQRREQVHALAAAAPLEKRLQRRPYRHAGISTSRRHERRVLRRTC